MKYTIQIEQNIGDQMLRIAKENPMSVISNVEIDEDVALEAMIEELCKTWVCQNSDRRPATMQEPINFNQSKKIGFSFYRGTNWVDLDRESYSLEMMAHAEAYSRLEAKEHHCQTCVSPSNGYHVSWDNESSYSIEYEKLVQETMRRTPMSNFEEVINAHLNFIKQSHEEGKTVVMVWTGDAEGLLGKNHHHLIVVDHNTIDIDSPKKKLIDAITNIVSRCIR